jgi:hypothetical protein
MTLRHSICSMVVLVVALSAAWGQDTSAQQSTDATPAPSPQQPVPAFGQENAPPAVSENPPISGLDLPNLEPHAAPLSYLQAGAHVSESVASNLQNALGGAGVHTISRAMGSLELQRLWSHYDLSLDYLGGVGYFNVAGIGLKQVEELGLTQKVTWKRGELSVRDAFSYQPEGTFGSAYGAIGTTGAGLAGQSAFFGGTGLGALGQVPRIMNLSVVDVVESLTPKSSITAAGGYGFVHFLGDDPGTGTTFIGSSQVSAQVGYNRLLGPHDQGALVYGYQGFDFSTGLNFHSHVIQVMWGHRISGRMDFMIAVGPQFTQINDLLLPVTNPTSADQIPPCVLGGSLSTGLVLECPTNDFRIGAAGRAMLRYRFPKVMLDMSYDHYLTSGSGFFAGAESDIAMLRATRPINRIWSASTDIGYSRNSRVLPLNCPATTTNCPGVSANVYSYGFAGASLHRNFGRTLHAYASYQFNYLVFDDSYCIATNPGPCSRISKVNIGTIGLDWIPRPVRLD